MRIIFWIILGALLLPGHFVQADEFKRPLKDAAPAQLAEYYLEMALKQGTGRLQGALVYADSLEMVAGELNNTGYLYNAYKIKGDYYRHTGDYNNAFYWLQQAYSLAKAGADTLGMVRILNNLGAVYQNTGALDKALENYLEAYFLGEHFLKPHQIGRVLLNIGLVHENLHQYKEALSYYQRALSLTEKAKDPAGLALVYTNLGALYNRQNDKEKATEHLKAARKIFESIKDESRLGEVLNEFSLVYLKDNPEISLEYLHLAEKLYRKNQNKAGLFEVQKNKGQANINLGNYKAAQKHLSLALEFSEELQNDFFKGEIYLKLARLSEAQEDFESATKFHNRYLALDHGQNRSRLLQNIASSGQAFEDDRKNQQIAILEQEAERSASRRVLYSSLLISLGLLLLVTTGMVILFFIRLKRSNSLKDLSQDKNQVQRVHEQEIFKQQQLINAKNAEIAHLREQSDKYYEELLELQQTFKEKTESRTKELEEALQKLSAHLDNTSLAIMEWNTSQELVNWPEQAEIIFGYKAREVLGLKIGEVPFLQHEDRKEVTEILGQLSRGETDSRHYTRKSYNRFGEPCFVEWSFSVLLNPAGEPESFLSVASDVTFREQTFRELKDANQELDTFLYKSSHDLRGPIARMQGIINLGLLESGDKEAGLYFNMLNKVTDELNNLLLRLLMVHNINQHSYQAVPLEFAAFTDALIAGHSPVKENFKEVKIVNNVPADLIIHSDETLLRIIMVNLLENGMRFADNFNPLIEIEAVYLPSGKYLINIADNGVEVPEEYREKIFDMFFQGSTRSTGTGLGLYMVRKAVKKLGGEVQLKSRKGYTNFEITLPAEKTKEFSKVTVIMQ